MSVHSASRTSTAMVGSDRPASCRGIAQRATHPARFPRCPAAPGKPPSRMLLSAATWSAVATVPGAFWLAVPDSYSEA